MSSKKAMPAPPGARPRPTEPRPEKGATVVFKASIAAACQVPAAVKNWFVSVRRTLALRAVPTGFTVTSSQTPLSGCATVSVARTVARSAWNSTRSTCIPPERTCAPT